MRDLRCAVLVCLALSSIPCAGFAHSRSEPPDATGKPPAVGGQIWVRVSPSRLVLGRQEIARIAAVFPRGAEDIAFFAAYGRIANVSMTSATDATAEYEPPDGYIPRVDVVAAVATVEGEKHWGFAAVLLIGQGEAELKTLKNAEAVIRIGDREFGPVRADEQGMATIEVEVPPGIRYGYDGKGKKIDLHVPLTARTAVFAETRRIRINEAEPISIFGVVVARDGSIDNDSKIEFVADRGIVDTVQPIGGGAFTARYTPPKDREGPIRIEAFVGGEEEPPSSEELALVPPSLWFDEFSMQPDDETDAPREHTKGHLFATPSLGLSVSPEFVTSFAAAVDFGGVFAIEKEHFSSALEVGLTLGAKEGDADVNATELRTELTTWTVPITVVAAWRRAMSDQVALAVFGQIGYSLVVNRLEAVGALEETQRMESEEMGHTAVLGFGTAAEWTAGIGAVRARVRVAWLPGDVESHRGTLTAVFLELGYRFWFNM